MTDDTDDRFDMWLKEQAGGYHNPPTPPTDEMWARIEAARREGGTTVRHRPSARPPVRPSFWIPLAAAALLVLGIGIGWLLKPGAVAPGGVTPAPVAAAPRDGGPAFTAAATDFLSQTEVFLTTFRNETQRGTVDEATAERARRLLGNTRLLLDSPAGKDVHLRMLLDDLELVLAEISALPSGRANDEAGIINEGLDQRGLLPRLRTAVPAGRMAVGS